MLVSLSVPIGHLPVLVS